MYHMKLVKLPNKYPSQNLDTLSRAWVGPISNHFSWKLNYLVELIQSRLWLYSNLLSLYKLVKLMRKTSKAYWAEVHITNRVTLFWAYVRFSFRSLGGTGWFCWTIGCHMLLWMTISPRQVATEASPSIHTDFHSIKSGTPFIRKKWLQYQALHNINAARRPVWRPKLVVGTV